MNSTATTKIIRQSRIISRPGFRPVRVVMGRDDEGFFTLLQIYPKDYEASHRTEKTAKCNFPNQLEAAHSFYDRIILLSS